MALTLEGCGSGLLGHSKTHWMDPNELKPLTTNHFLFGRASPYVPLAPSEDSCVERSRLDTRVPKLESSEYLLLVVGVRVLRLDYRYFSGF